MNCTPVIFSVIDNSHMHWFLPDIHSVVNKTSAAQNIHTDGSFSTNLNKVPHTILKYEG